MSSTLCIRKTPVPEKEPWAFKLPLKAIIARKFYDHDGSCGGGMITVGGDSLDWFEGVAVAGKFNEYDSNCLREIIQILREGGTVDMWFEI